MTTKDIFLTTGFTPKRTVIIGHEMYKCWYYHTITVERMTILYQTHNVNR